MPSAGDRVVFEGVKIGGGRREGRLVSIEGRAVRVRWEDGSESLMFPGPGAMRVLEPGSKKKTAGPVKKAAAKKAPKAVPAKKAAAAKAVPKKAAAKKAPKKGAPARAKGKKR